MFERVILFCFVLQRKPGGSAPRSRATRKQSNAPKKALPLRKTTRTALVPLKSQLAARRDKINKTLTTYYPIAKNYQADPATMQHLVELVQPTEQFKETVDLPALKEALTSNSVAQTWANSLGQRSRLELLQMTQQKW